MGKRESSGVASDAGIPVDGVPKNEFADKDKEGKKKNAVGVTDAHATTREKERAGSRLPVGVQSAMRKVPPHDGSQI